MKKFYVTFSNCGSQFFTGGHSVVMAKDMAEARSKTFNAYGPKFFTVYSEEDWKENERKGFIGFNRRLNETIE